MESTDDYRSFVSVDIREKFKTGFVMGMGFWFSTLAMFWIPILLMLLLIWIASP